MKKIKLFVALFYIIINCNAQLTPNDFKLSLDNYIINGDSTYYTITKKQLLDAKRLIPNFNWATIKHISVYISNSCTMFGTPEASVNDLGKLKNIFTRIVPGSYLTFDVKVVNKKNKEVSWSLLSFKVID
jgi:hypothetical protein